MARANAAASLSALPWIGGDLMPDDLPDGRWPAFTPDGFLHEGQGAGPSGPPPRLFASGRAALARLLGALGVAGGTVLVPASGCAAITLAVRMAGADPAHYPGDADLRPDAAALQGLARTLGTRARAVIWVHAFGWRSEPPLGLPPLVEDASHTVCNAPGHRVLGAAGGAVAVAASLRKALPVAAGLCARWDGGGIPPAGEADADAYAVARAKAGVSEGMERHRWLQRAEEALDAQPRPGGPGDDALRMMHRLGSLPPASATCWRDKCRANWEALGRMLQRTRCQPMHTCAPDGVCPLGFVVRHPDRGRLARHLLRHRVVATWHWPPAPEALPHMPRMERLTVGTLLTLPCDGRYGEADMARVAALCRD